ncbi:MAG: ABC transporter ATP-binding protein [Phycisphaeraceae bacterium]|nr:ABC transporter ATP-binding protein [Phycisphaeraceae bacterium]
MRDLHQTSRQRYAQYRERRREQRSQDAVAEHDKQPRLSRSRTRPIHALLGGFWAMLRGRRWLLAGALTTLTIATLLQLIMPAATKVVIDYILTDNPGPEGLPAWARVSTDRSTLLWTLAGAMVTASILAVIFSMIGRWRMTRLTKVLQANLRRKAFEHAVRLPLSRVYELKSGGMSSFLRDDAGGAAELVFSLIYNPWRAVIQLAGTMIILASVDWRLLFGALALIPIIWFTHRTWINAIRPVYRDIRNSRTLVDSQSAEAFGGMRVVRGFGRERGESARFVGLNNFMLRQEILAWWRSRAIDVSWQLMIPFASVGVLLYGGLGVINKSLTIGDVMMFSAYLIMLLAPLETLASTATAAQNNLAGFDRFLDLLEEEQEFGGADVGARLPRDQVKGAIALRGVRFRYPKAEHEALSGIDLDVRPGETIALVGPSGAGKTTLCNLVARFYDPTEGVVTIDGADLRDINLADYRSLLGIVEQEIFLFDGTIAQNIAYARPDSPHADIERAAKVANAHDFITETENGYETLIGERGVRLSGGQKQRIAIARAVLADPRILILDEATSSLDTASERLIQRSLEQLMKGRTSFVIAHRLSTIRNSSRIVVIENGAITEIGPHEQLLELRGHYARLLRMQVEDENDEQDEDALPAILPSSR